jgi:hypothetical protein
MVYAQVFLHPPYQTLKMVNILVDVMVYIGGLKHKESTRLIKSVERRVLLLLGGRRQVIKVKVVSLSGYVQKVIYVGQM